MVKKKVQSKKKQKTQANEGGTRRAVRPTKQVRNTRTMIHDVPNGFGVYISPDTGDSYLRVSSQLNFCISCSFYNSCNKFL